MSAIFFSLIYVESLYPCQTVSLFRKSIYKTFDMMRIPLNTLMRQNTSILRCSRLMATDPQAGSINAAHDKFSEREQALENAYFRKQNEELLTKLRKHKELLEKTSNEIEIEQKRIEQEIKRLEKQREELIRFSFKAAKQ